MYLLMSRVNRFARSPSRSRSSTMSLTPARIPVPLNPRQKKQVKSLIRHVQELKYHVTEAIGQQISTTPTIQDLTAITQGDTDQTRDGDRLQLAGKIDFRFHLFIGDSSNVVRVIIFQWHPNSTPSAGQILLNGPTGVIDYLSTYSHDNRQEYRILFDKVYSLIGDGVADVSAYTTLTQIVRVYRISLKKATKMVQFAAATVDGTNKIYILRVSDSNAIPYPLMGYQAKVFFRDS